MAEDNHVGLSALVITLVGTLLPHAFTSSDSFSLPSEAVLASLNAPQRVVAIADSQVNYTTEPPNLYCNKFSAYWGAGSADCQSGERSEEWCADFAAGVWLTAGVSFTYGYAPAEINSGAVSFYEWGVANGEWHPANNEYVASPGDVAVYGLSQGANPLATHVAIVIDDAAGQPGPDVVNGDGDRTGFPVVETRTAQAYADVGYGGSTLAAYVSPPETSLVSLSRWGIPYRRLVGVRHPEARLIRMKGAAQWGT